MNELEKAALNHRDELNSYLWSSSQDCSVENAKEAFIAGAQWQANQSPWISVEERTPETDDDLYFVLDTTIDPPGVGLCDFDVNSRTWVDNYHLVVNPTHWMPIPE